MSLSGSRCTARGVLVRAGAHNYKVFDAMLLTGHATGVREWDAQVLGADNVGRMRFGRCALFFDETGNHEQRTNDPERLFGKVIRAARNGDSLAIQFAVPMSSVFGTRIANAIESGARRQVSIGLFPPTETFSRLGQRPVSHVAIVPHGAMEHTFIYDGGSIDWFDAPGTQPADLAALINAPQRTPIDATQWANKRVTVQSGHELGAHSFLPACEAPVDESDYVRAAAPVAVVTMSATDAPAFVQDAPPQDANDVVVAAPAATPADAQTSSAETIAAMRELAETYASAAAGSVRQTMPGRYTPADAQKVLKDAEAALSTGNVTPAAANALKAQLWLMFDHSAKTVSDADRHRTRAEFTEKMLAQALAQREATEAAAAARERAMQEKLDKLQADYSMAEATQLDKTLERVPPELALKMLREANMAPEARASGIVTMSRAAMLRVFDEQCKDDAERASARPAVAPSASRAAPAVVTLSHNALSAQQQQQRQQAPAQVHRPGKDPLVEAAMDALLGQLGNPMERAMF